MGHLEYKDSHFHFHLVLAFSTSVSLITYATVNLWGWGIFCSVLIVFTLPFVVEQTDELHHIIHGMNALSQLDYLAFKCFYTEVYSHLVCLLTYAWIK